MNRVLTLLVSLPLLLGVLPAALAAPAHARAADPAVTYSSKAHSATNQARKQNGVGRLKKSTCLKTYAANQALAMAAAQEISHQDLGPVLDGCGLRTAGENVASGLRNGKAVVKAWMASEGHRRNILTKAYKQEAIVAVRGSDGAWYVAQVFGG